jgi:hypothetical protein
MYEVPSRDDVAKVVINLTPCSTTSTRPWCRESTPAANVTAAKGPPTGLRETYLVHAAALLMRDVVTAAAFS